MRWCVQAAGAQIMGGGGRRRRAPAVHPRRGQVRAPAVSHRIPRVLAYPPCFNSHAHCSLQAPQLPAEFRSLLGAPHPALQLATRPQPHQGRHISVPARSKDPPACAECWSSPCLPWRCSWPPESTCEVQVSAGGARTASPRPGSPLGTAARRSPLTAPPLPACRSARRPAPSPAPAAAAEPPPPPRFRRLPRRHAHPGRAGGAPAAGGRGQAPRGRRRPACLRPPALC